MNKINYKSLAFHLLVPIMLLFIVMMLVTDFPAYYNSLEKLFPKLPSFVFFGIYGLVYFFFGLAAYFIEEAEGNNKKAFNYYYIALLINLLYIPITFGTRSLLVGFLWCVLLVIFVYLTFKEFKKVNKTSGKLMIVYLVISIFLTYYTFMIYLLNK